MIRRQRKMVLALKLVRQGVPVKRAAGEAEVNPGSLYKACREEGISVLRSSAKPVELMLRDGRDTGRQAVRLAGLPLYREHVDLALDIMGSGLPLEIAAKHLRHQAGGSHAR